MNAKFLAFVAGLIFSVTSFAADLPPIVSGQLGDAGTIENRILAFEPEKLLAIKVAKAPKTFPFPNAVQSMWTIIYLSEAANGQTHVRAVGLGFTDSPESTRMREFFQKGNDYTLEELRKHFAK